MNLPVKITFQGGETIAYTYLADGTKIKKTVTEGSTNKTVDYLDGYQYEEGKINFFPTSEGYVQVILFDSGDYSYHYVYPVK